MPQLPESPGLQTADPEAAPSQKADHSTIRLQKNASLNQEKDAGTTDVQSVKGLVGESDSASVATDTPPPARKSFPRVGEQRFGFELINELGRGSFGQVFLARQPHLGNRLVVLKVGSELSQESEKLGLFQHPNIAPVYSFHREGHLQAFCMPYLGAVTLGHILNRVRDTKLSTLNGKLLSTVLSDCLQSKSTDVPTSVVNPSNAQLLDINENTEEATAELNKSGRATVPYANSSYVDAVVWIIARVAEGLSAAHAADVIHSDLKPANILISQEGQPILIDFGVSFNYSARMNVIKIGGTRPYMSPEQLRSVHQEELNFDKRSDLYSLGVIFFELLTTQRPFDSVYAVSKNDVASELSIREKPLSVRLLNPRVSWGVEAIVQKCLAFDPEQRYQSAEELHEDLVRQQNHQPLKYARNISSLELAQKFVVRNRWWLTLTGCLVGSVVLAGGIAFHNQAQTEEYTRLQVKAQEQQFIQHAKLAVAQLETANRGGPALATALETGYQALSLYRVLSIQDSQPSKTKELAAALLLSMGRASALEAANTKPEAKRNQLFDTARAHTKQAGEMLRLESPRAAAVQMVWLNQLSNNPDAYQSDLAEVKKYSPLTALDYRTEGTVLMLQAKAAPARDNFSNAIQLDPQDYWSLFNSGIIKLQSGQADWKNALELFDRCISLDPSVAGAYYNRGLVKLKLRMLKEAVDDFTQIISLRDDWAEAYLNRATAREGNREFQGAIQDLSKALELGYSSTPVLLARSRVYRHLKQDDLAKQDLESALNDEPTDERGWIARGVARLPAQNENDMERYRASLIDFTRALELNPKSLTALQFIARIYSITGKNVEGVEMLNEQLRHYPDSIDALSGRAMLYSRLGERQKAHADAEKAERLTDHPRTIYQLAGVYAMTSKTNPEDKAVAYRHLAYALRKGYGMTLLSEDRELDPIRSESEFSRVVEDAKRFLEQEKKK
jgi:eukaryotic-like serine/threonine-protein kinase